MRQYNSTNSCPKCGHKGAGTRYQPEGMDKTAISLMNIKVYEQECLVRTCTRCGYEWEESIIEQ